VDQGILDQVLGSNDDGFTPSTNENHKVHASLTVLGEQRDHGTVSAPDDILDGRGSQLGQNLLLLNVEQDNAGRSAEQNAGGAAIEDVVGLGRALDRLGDGVAQISNLDVLSGFVEDGEPVSSDKEGGRARAALAVRFLHFAAFFGQMDQLVDASFSGRSDDDGAFGRIVRDGARLNELRAEFTDRDDRSIVASVEIVRSNVLVPDVEERVAMNAIGRTFSVQLKDDQARVVSCAANTLLSPEGQKGSQHAPAAKRFSSG
jgi:hypothetical protein